MRFYTKQHRYYCGIALHARRMYICILDAEGTIRVHRNGPATPEQFLATIAPYGEDLVVAVECIFTWYWVADLCAKEGIAFVLGHALYMKAIHGGKATDIRSRDRSASFTAAELRNAFATSGSRTTTFAFGLAASALHGSVWMPGYLVISL